MTSLLLALALTGTVNSDSMKGPIRLQDEGTSLGNVTTLNCVGAGIACTRLGQTGTVTVAAAAGGSTTANQVNVGSGSDSVGTTLPDTTAPGQALTYNQSTKLFGSGPVTSWPWDRWIMAALATGSGSWNITVGGSLTFTGTATQEATVFGHMQYIQYASAATTSSQGGITNGTGPFTSTAQHVDRVRFQSFATSRYWIGFVVAGTTATTVAASSANNFKHAAIGVDTSSLANFQCCSSAGSGSTCTDMGVAPVINTDYIITTTLVSGSSLTCTVQADGGAITSTPKSDKILDCTANSCLPSASVTALANSAATIWIARHFLVQL